MPKTIKELNQKAWYRFLKVIFILCFLFLSIGIILFSYIYCDNAAKTIDREKTIITCKNEERSSFYLNQSVIYLNLYNINEFKTSKNLSEYLLDLNKDIEIECGLPVANEYDYSKPYWERGQPLLNPLGEYDYKWEIDPVTKIKYKYLNLILYSIIGILILSILLEIIKRIFYYIALGTIFPKKE